MASSEIYHDVEVGTKKKKRMDNVKENAAKLMAGL